MIRIQKPDEAPEILRKRGKQKATLHSQAYEKDAAKYRSGECRFVFDATIYGAPEVKAALVEAQHSKCCFCESKVGDDGDVEHFRPKAACCQSPKASLIRPGYYWLAYEWDNLMLSCSACNQRSKRNQFPLIDPRQRVNHHGDDLGIEQPVFINPGREDPEQFISFRQEFAFPLGKRGKATIDAIRLNREILTDRRRDRLAWLDCLRELVARPIQASDPPDFVEAVKTAKNLLAQSAEDSAEFAGCVRANRKNSL